MPPFFTKFPSSIAGPGDPIELEQQRCEAISAGDLEILDRLLADDLTHTHTSGHTEDKATYLAGLGGRPRVATRRAVKVRVYGDTAIMTGTLVNAFPPDAGIARSPFEAHALQVWVKSGDGWQQAAFAASALPPG